MSILIRLYPQPWRDRYEAEVLDLLAERPVSVRDAVDLVRGAADAHLHQPGRAPMPWTWRLPGLIALVAGCLVSLFVLLVSSQSGPDWGLAGSFPGMALMLMLVSLPGDYLGRERRALTVGGAAFCACIVAANILGPGGPSVAFAIVASLLALSGPLAMAGLRAGIGARGRWVFVLAGVFAPLAVMAVITVVREWTGVALVDVAARTTALFGLPYGLAWLCVGCRMLIRGSETIVDPPAPAATPDSRSALDRNPFDQEIPA